MVLLHFMSQPNPALHEEPSQSPPDLGWIRELGTLLGQAAQLAAAHGLEGDAFKRAAWDAYLDARPGLRQELEVKQLKAQLRKLRRLGLVGSA